MARRRMFALGAAIVAASLGISSATTSDPRSERLLYSEMLARAYVPGRSGQIFIVPEKGCFAVARAESVDYRFMHGSPWDYDTRVPLLFYGRPFVRQGTFDGSARLQDIAPTLLAIVKSPAPTTMSGQVLTKALSGSRAVPRVVLLVVLDGLGANTWARLSDSLPTFRRLRREGAWFSRAALDYLPSVTSTGHATIATGTDPRFHGIQGNSTYDPRTGKAEGPFPAMSPASYRVPTLADYWKLATSSHARIVVQGTTERATVGLAGHGACMANGSRIAVAMYDDVEGVWAFGNSCFRLPRYIASETTREFMDRRWMGETVTSGKSLLRTGLFPEFQFRALVSMIEKESVGRDSIPDLVLVNLKTPDYIAHRYGPESAKMTVGLRALDLQFGKLLAALDSLVGPQQYVLAITADHGMPPEPEPKRHQIRIFTEDLESWLHARFDPEKKLLRFPDAGDHQIYVDRARLEVLGLRLETIADSIESLPSIRFAITEETLLSNRLKRY